MDMMIRNVKLVELNISIADDLIEYKCLYCNKKEQQKFDKQLKERFLNTCKHPIHDNNKFILLL